MEGKKLPGNIKFPSLKAVSPICVVDWLAWREEWIERRDINFATKINILNTLLLVIFKILRRTFKLPDITSGSTLEKEFLFFFF